MLDKSIPYYNVLMKRDKGCILQTQPLPEGFTFASFKAGNEKDWAEIEASVGEFDRAVDALVYFQRDYLPFKNELERRCIFIENSEGKKVATLTVWWCYTGKRRDRWLHWVACTPEYQGRGLGKALVFEGLRRLIEIEGDRDVYLHTQTWSYKAINIYRLAGFMFTREKGLAGYENTEYDQASELLQKYLCDQGV